MKIDGVTVLIIIAAVALIIFASQRCSLRCTTSEGFGQDASIRASSGGLAGPKGMYGYDPIDQFAAQIEEMKAAKQAARDGAFVMGLSRPRNLVSSPTGDVGPEHEREAFREGYTHAPEEDPESEAFEMPKCGACMSTEDFD
jgi:hypothetical protein